MRIHAFNTAILTVKRRYRQAEGKTRLARLTSSLLDHQFIEIPVYAWMIEHPEGLIVIDAGESARVNEPGYFPLLQRPYWRSQYRFRVTPDTEAGAQIRQLGYSPEEVRWVVLTHAHFDHTDALYHFPNAEFLLSRKERDDVYRWRSAHFALPAKWPSWFHPRPIDYVPEPLGPFAESYPLTEKGDVHIVPTPGHTSGHQSVLLEADGVTYFFGGDTSFDLESLRRDVMDAPSFNADANYETRRRILNYAQLKPLVYLTTHDHDTKRRLDAREVLHVESIAPETA